ncbi:MAG TPA: hypothetical protein VNM14_17975 [Planctomycetota bacterium]|nr:hypothetical protein [Planctomycetota bacterium]
MARKYRCAILIAAGALLLAGAAVLARSSPSVRRADAPRSSAVSPEVQIEVTEDGSTKSLESQVAAFVELLKAEGSAGISCDSASLWVELLETFPMPDLLGQIGRHAPLEEGFSVLRKGVAETSALRESVLQVVAAANADPETRMFALRLLPSFAHLGALEREAFLRQMERIPEGELGCQVLRYVSKNSSEERVSAWLSQVLDRCGNSQIRVEALRVLVGFPDPTAVTTLKRCFEDPDVPDSHRARILASLCSAGPAPEIYARHPWLPAALERSIRLRPGDTVGSDRQELVSYAVTILARNGDEQKLSCLLESEKVISEPGGRALIAFALRWLPTPDAGATLASMASNPLEFPKVRLVALESLQGKKTAELLQRLMPISSERDVPGDLKAAFESFLRE